MWLVKQAVHGHAHFYSTLHNTSSGTHRNVEGVHFGSFIGSEEHSCTLGHKDAIRKQNQQHSCDMKPLHVSQLQHMSWWSQTWQYQPSPDVCLQDNHYRCVIIMHSHWTGHCRSKVWDQCNLGQEYFMCTIFLIKCTEQLNSKKSHIGKSYSNKKLLLKYIWSTAIYYLSAQVLFRNFIRWKFYNEILNWKI